MILFGLIFVVSLCFASEAKTTASAEIVSPNTAQTITSTADVEGNIVILEEYQ